MNGCNCRHGSRSTMVKAVQRRTSKRQVQSGDVVATFPGRDEELQGLGQHHQEPTATTNVEGAAKHGEKEKTKRYGNRNEIGPDAVKPISFELGRPGPQTTTALQGLTTNERESV